MVGGTVARHREARAGPGVGIGDGLADAARDRLSKAVTELRYLTQDQLFQALGRLTDVADIRVSSLNGDSIPRFRDWSDGHLRVAAELGTAIRCCRLVEEKLRQQLDVLLPGPDEQLRMLAEHGPGQPPGKSPGRGMASWLKVLSPRSRSAHEQCHQDAATEAPEGGKRALAPPVAKSLPAPSRPEADIAAKTLGALELDVAGRRVVSWTSLKARGVLQYLLLHRGQPVRRDVLMRLQWPDHTPASARNNLNVALYSLRNTLDGPWQGLQPVLYRDGCYLLNPALTWWIDRDEFLYALYQAQLSHLSSHHRNAICHYQGAVGLYRGPLFEDDLSGDWYLPEQRHLNELYLEALESLGEIYFDLGELASAARFGQRALTSDPCCEPAHRLLMRCYAREHKQQLVGRQFRLCADALRGELDVAPGAETLRLFHSLTSASR